MESHIMLLAQPLMKNRSWNIDKKSYERETCMFRELTSTFRIVKLENVFRCCNENTKSVQNFVRNKDNVFKTKMDKHRFEQRQQTENKSSNDSIKANESFYCGMDLDEAFERSPSVKTNNAVKSKVVRKFGFLCKPKQGTDIKGLKPNLRVLRRN